MARVWLHIGHGKTGTTAIQAAIRHRAATRADLFYPGRGQTPAGAHHLLFPLGRDPWPAETVKALTALAAELDALAAGRPVVLSSEHLCYAAPANVATLAGVLAGHAVRVIYYIRRQDELIETTWRQKRIEAPGRYATPEAFVADTARGLDFLRRLAPWEEAFGRDRIVVRLYHRATCAADVVCDFEGALGLAPGAGPAPRINPSLSPAMAEVLALFDRLYPDAARRPQFIDGLKALDEPAGAPAALVPAALCRAAMARHAASNAEVARRYLDAGAAALFTAPA